MLDIASGTAYGSRYLAQYAGFVVSCDLSQTALLVANQTKQKNLALVRGDACRIPCKESIFDTVVSFETIEHLKKTSQHLFLLELRRVLKPGGTLICSSPRAEVIQMLAGRSATWSPFHETEMTFAEFQELVNQDFHAISILGQDKVSVRRIIKAWVGYALRGLLGSKYQVLRMTFRRIRPLPEISPIQSGAQIDESLLDARFLPTQFTRSSRLAPITVVIVAKKPTLAEGLRVYRKVSES